MTSGEVFCPHDDSSQIGRNSHFLSPCRPSLQPHPHVYLPHCSPKPRVGGTAEGEALRGAHTFLSLAEGRAWTGERDGRWAGSPATFLGQSPMALGAAQEGVSAGASLNAQKQPQVGKYLHTWRRAGSTGQTAGEEKGVAHSAHK